MNVESKQTVNIMYTYAGLAKALGYLVYGCTLVAFMFFDLHVNHT
jgi:hypothetical protein